MRLPLVAAGLSAAALAVAGCGGSSDSSTGSGASGAKNATSHVNLVAYSTPQVVYDELIPKFDKTGPGEGVGFSSSYGPSGDQSRAVLNGQKADVVTFSTEPDMTKLVKAGLVQPSWDQGPNKGLITTSVVTFIVRKGNPKHIHTWADLLKPGVKVLTPNPYTSGAAKWNILAAYGQASDDGKNPAAGLSYLKQLISKHVVVQDKSGRDALQNFTSGTGDVCISYENEAITAQRKGKKVDYVIPDKTIKINIDIAKTAKASPKAQAFIDYALSTPGQQDFASWGYRPVNAQVLAANKAKFPTPKDLFTIGDFGGWSKVNDQLFDPEKGSITGIEQSAGVSTAK